MPVAPMWRKQTHRGDYRGSPSIQINTLSHTLASHPEFTQHSLLLHFGKHMESDYFYALPDYSSTIGKRLSLKWYSNSFAAQVVMTWCIVWCSIAVHSVVCLIYCQVALWETAVQCPCDIIWTLAMSEVWYVDNCMVCIYKVLQLL